MGISSVFSVVALLGFVLFLFGIGTAVLSSSQGRNWRSGAGLAAVGLVIGLAFSVISQGVLIIQPTEIAVVFNTVNGNLETPRRSGTNLIVPIVQQYTIYPLEQQQYTMSGSSNEGARVGDDAVRGRTIDGQEVQIDVSILFGINPGDSLLGIPAVNLVHQRWQNRYVDDLIRPTTRSIVRDVVSQFRAEEIYGERRGEMETGIQSALGVRMEEEGFVLTDLLVRDINFSQQFTESIEQAQIAEQEANRARLQVQRIEQEAEQARAEAAGLRDAEIVRAEGEAEAIILRAQAEAEGLRLVSQQIAANPSLIQYQYIQNLSDNVELVLVPSQSPFLFDLASLANPDANFTAPENDPNPLTIVPTATPTPGS